MKLSLVAVRIARAVALIGAWFMMHGAIAHSVLAPQVATVPANSLALAAANIGVKQCLPEVTALAELGVQGSIHNDVLFDWDRQRGGDSSVFSLMGLEYAKGNAAMSVTAVPELGGSCSVAAERISVAPSSCKAVAQQELGGYRATPLLGHMTVYTEAKDLSSTVSLIDSPPGCLVIRRYVKFLSRAQASGK